MKKAAVLCTVLSAVLHALAQLSTNMANQEDEHQQNKLGVIGATSYVVGNIIGSGIFITPSTILSLTGSAGLSLLIWTASGLLTLLGALSYLELGTSMPQSGGAYAYICHVQWHPIAFAFMWVSVTMLYPGSTAIMVVTFGKYVVEAILPLNCIDPAYRPTPEKLFGFVLLLTLSWLNMMPLQRYAAKLQIAITTFKVLSLGVIIFTGFYFLIFKGRTEAFENAFSGTKLSPRSVVLGLYSGLYAFSGWNLMNIGLEDAKSPKKALIIGQFGGASVVLLVYIATIIAYLAVLGKDGMLKSDAVAATFSQEVLGNFSYVIPIIVGVVLCGSINSDIFGASRFSFAAARNCHLPSCMAMLEPGSDSPRPAVLIQCLLAIVLSFVGNLEQLINYVSFGEWMQHAVTMIAIVWIRYRQIPVHQNAVKMPIIVHVAFFCVSTLLVVVPIFDTPVIAAIGFAITASGFVIYYLFVWPSKLPKWLHIVNDKTTIFSQVILNCLLDKEFLTLHKKNRRSSTDQQSEIESIATTSNASNNYGTLDTNVERF